MEEAREKWFGWPRRRDETLLNENKDKRFVIGCLRLRTSGSRVSAFSDLHGAAHAGLAFYFLSLSRRAWSPPWPRWKDKERQKASVYRLPTLGRPRFGIHRTSCVQQHRCANRRATNGFFPSTSVSSSPATSTSPKCRASFRFFFEMFRCSARKWNLLVLYVELVVSQNRNLL